MWGVAARNFYVQNFDPNFFCAIADPSRTISSLESMSIGPIVFDDMRAPDPVFKMSKIDG